MSISILEHPSYYKSYELLKTIGQDIKVLHYHSHVLLTLRQLLGSKRITYVEIGTNFNPLVSNLIFSSDDPTDLIIIDSLHDKIISENETKFLDQTFKYYKPIHHVKLVANKTFDKHTTTSYLKKLLKNNTIDLIFINGLPGYRQVVHNFINIHDQMSPDSYIVFNNYLDHVYSPHVKRGVDWITKLFKPWYNIIGCLPNVIQADGGPFANSSMETHYNNFILHKKKEEVHINFAIIMATYHRKNGSTLNKIKKAFHSIQKQSYPHWTLILVGDKYENPEEFDEITKLIPEDKIIYQNLDQAYERELHQQGKITVRQLWNNAGASAMSAGLDIAQNAGFTHVAHLDDDDTWEPNHLEELNKTYLEFPETIFAYTCGRFINNIIPRQIDDVKIQYDNLPPVGRNLLHSATSWRLDFIDLRYPKINLENVDQAAQEVLNTPADALMWERVRKYMAQRQYSSMYIPQITVNHLEEGADYF